MAVGFHLGGEFVEEAQVQRAFLRKHPLVRQFQLLAEDADDLLRGRGRDLQADCRQLAAALEQVGHDLAVVDIVVHHPLFDVDVGVAGDAEEAGLLHGILAEDEGRIVQHQLLGQGKLRAAVPADDLHPLHLAGNGDHAEALLPFFLEQDAEYKMGARPAEPGEFTKRAFLNGRIDLIQAEAVMDIIKSRSEASLKMAVRQQDGQLSKKIKGLRRNLLDIVVNLEAVIDYPEEDIEEITFNTVSEGMERVKQELEYLLKHAHTGKILREGLQTVIVGRPNVGKSSLLNALLSEERAIVSEYAGTTRDVIEEQLLLGSVPLVLVDTAGIRQTEDYVEKIGVARSKERLDKAELAVVVLDGSQPLNEEDEEILNAVAGKPCVIIVNKGDRPQVNDLTALQKRFGKDRVLLLSAKTGGGLEQFTAWLQSYVYGSEHAISGGAYVQNTRHENLLREALLSVEEAIRAAASMLPYDCLVIDLHKAIDAMGLITGDTLQDEIINEIFSKFCVGK